MDEVLKNAREIKNVDWEVFKWNLQQSTNRVKHFVENNKKKVIVGSVAIGVIAIVALNK